MQSSPLISVVVTTYNRCKTLKITLEKLAQQSIPYTSFEVLLMDDESPDSTPEMVKLLKYSVPYKLRYFRHENRGPGYTQNRGIKESLSSLVLLMADDIWSAPQLLEEHLKTHSEFPEENVAVLSKVLPSPELPSTVMHKYWDPFRHDLFEGKHEIDPVFFLGCSISIKRNFLLKNGMYREKRAIAHEDIELGYRLGQKGLRIIHNERAVAYHYHVETLSRACERSYHRGYNFNLISENTPKSFIFPFYHILSIDAGLKTSIKMLFREVPKNCVFNRWSIEKFWVPILEKAETNPIARLFANSITYRCVVGYYLSKGYKDWKRKKRKEKSAPL